MKLHNPYGDSPMAAENVEAQGPSAECCANFLQISQANASEEFGAKWSAGRNEKRRYPP